jgi:hypothetical protein
MQRKTTGCGLLALLCVNSPRCVGDADRRSLQDRIDDRGGDGYDASGVREVVECLGVAVGCDLAGAIADGQQPA